MKRIIHPMILRSPQWYMLLRYLDTISSDTGVNSDDKSLIYIQLDGFQPAIAPMARVIKDYGLGINYHPGKANIVADVLNHERYPNATQAGRKHQELQREIEYLNLGMVNEATGMMEVEPTLEGEI
jgi:hypothetical protein